MSAKNYQLTSFKILIISMIGIFFLMADRLLKFLAVHFFVNHAPVNLIPGLKFNFLKNHGLAFSLNIGSWPIIILSSFLIIGLIVAMIYYFKKNSQLWLAVWLIILGAMSNLFDRFNYGFVVDYLDLKYFTVFNLGDAMILAGVVWLVVKNCKLRIKN